MSLRCGQRRLRLAHRTLNTGLDSAASVLEGRDGPLILDTPSALTECAPVNITWTGGVPPYALQANFGDMSGFDERYEPEIIGTDINTTYFQWSTNVPSGFLVWLELIDALDDRRFATGAPLVGYPLELCVDPPLIHPRILQGAVSSFSTNAITPSPSMPVFGSSSAHGVATSAFPAASVSLPPPPPDAPQQSGSLPIGSAIALIFLGILFFLLLGTFPWWRSCMTIRKREVRECEYLASPFHPIYIIEDPIVDTEKQDVAGENRDEVRLNISGPREPVWWGLTITMDQLDGGALERARINGWSLYRYFECLDRASEVGVDIITRTTERLEPLSVPVSNPFEDPGNVASMAQILIVSPVSPPGDQTPALSSLTSPPPSAPGPHADINIVSAQPLRLKAAVVPRSRYAY